MELAKSMSYKVIGCSKQIQEAMHGLPEDIVVACADRNSTGYEDRFLGAQMAAALEAEEAGKDLYYLDTTYSVGISWTLVIPPMRLFFIASSEQEILDRLHVAWVLNH